MDFFLKAAAPITLRMTYIERPVLPYAGAMSLQRLKPARRCVCWGFSLPSLQFEKKIFKKKNATQNIPKLTILHLALKKLITTLSRCLFSLFFSALRKVPLISSARALQGWRSASRPNFVNQKITKGLHRGFFSSSIRHRVMKGPESL